MERGEDDGSEQPSSSNPVQSLYFKRITEEIERKFNIFRQEIPLIVIKTVRQEIIPAVLEVSLRKVVQEEIQKVLPRGTRNDVPEERSLHLKFLDEVSGPVLTSKEFKGLKDGPLKVALFNAMGNPVTSGPESSAEVEILLIDATGNDSESNTTNENFERRIIRAGDKGKPHFAKNVYVQLDKGEAVLINQKLGQDKDWTKTWTCRLGARFVKDFRGLKVQNAWTEPFEVKDKRGDLYKNLELPLLTSEVWRLKGIGKDGEPRKRLGEAKIETVQDFLFWHSVNPKELLKIFDGGKKAGKNRWNTIVNHAETCKSDDERLYSFKSSTEPQMAVVYDSVGKLKGVIIEESHFVPIDDLSAEEKDHAGKLLLSLVLNPDAFVGRYQTFFDDEASLLLQYPYKSSGVDTSTNCSIQQRLNPIDPGCSSQLISRPPILDPEDIPTDRGTTSLGFDQPDGNENAGASTPSNTNDSAEFWNLLKQLFPGCSNAESILTASPFGCENAGASDFWSSSMHSPNPVQDQTSKRKRWSLSNLYHVVLIVDKFINVTHLKRKKLRVR